MEQEYAHNLKKQHKKKYIPYTRPLADSANRGPATTADCPGPGGHSPRACHVTGPFQ